MTYYEWLKSIVNEPDKVAQFLCNLVVECDGCAASDYCKAGRNGFAVMLNNDCEVEEWKRN